MIDGSVNIRRLLGVLAMLCAFTSCGWSSERLVEDEVAHALNQWLAEYANSQESVPLRDSQAFVIRQIEQARAVVEESVVIPAIARHLEWCVYESDIFDGRTDGFDPYLRSLFEELLKSDPSYTIEWIGDLVVKYQERPVGDALKTFIYTAGVHAQMKEKKINGISQDALAEEILPLITGVSDEGRIDMLMLLLRPRDISILPEDMKQRLAGGKDSIPALAPNKTKRHILDALAERDLSFEVRQDLLWSLHHVGMDDGRYRSFLERVATDDDRPEKQRSEARRHLRLLEHAEEAEASRR